MVLIFGNLYAFFQQFVDELRPCCGALGALRHGWRVSAVSRLSVGCVWIPNVSSGGRQTAALPVGLRLRWRGIRFTPAGAPRRCGLVSENRCQHNLQALSLIITPIQYSTLVLSKIHFYIFRQKSVTFGVFGSRTDKRLFSGARWGAVFSSSRKSLLFHENSARARKIYVVRIFPMCRLVFIRIYIFTHQVFDGLLGAGEQTCCKMFWVSPLHIWNILYKLKKSIAR